MTRTDVFKAFSGPVPDYRNNFTNWLDFRYVEGMFRLVIVQTEENYEIQFHVPTKFSAGVGDIEIYNLSFNGQLIMLESTMAGHPFSFRYKAGAMHMDVVCFGRAYSFAKTSSAGI